ncbi:MAG: 50S ribosomal protein L3 [Candidatus Bathyarchaeota archaeon]
MSPRKKNAPRRGSRSFSPRKHAKSLLARTRHWPEISADAPQLLGFIGYKAGMTHIFKIEDRKRSPTYGKEVIRSATVLETPPMIICAIRTYGRSSKGLQTLTEAWMKDPPEQINRVLTMPESFDTDDKLKKIGEKFNEVEKIRVLAITQPRQTSISKKVPELMEIEIGGGTSEEQFEYAKGLLGKPIPSTEVFKEGQYVDTIAVTIGKGLQGPVKRWGVRILQRKARKTKRGIATLGPWTPRRVRSTVPRAGQMGFHQRTEYNKRIVKMGPDGKDVTPKGGFVRYGIVQGSYMVIEGSVPGPEKRPIKLRYPARPPKHAPEESSQAVYLSLESPQGK